MPKTPDYFAGKTIVITGAASGIGRATALIFARERANVVCADINEAAARATAEAGQRQAGSQALALKVDVTSRAQVDAMVTRAISAFGRVHFLFNSAGAAIRRAKFLDIDDALLQKPSTSTSTARSTACRRCCRTCSRTAWRHRQHGEHGAPPRRPRLLGALRRGQGRSGVDDPGRGARIRHPRHPRLVDLAGPIKTPFQDAAQSSPELVQRFLEDVPMKRFGEPEEIGELVLFMCSDACKFMTADTVYVNGGGGWR